MLEERSREALKAVDALGVSNVERHYGKAVEDSEGI